MGKRGANNTTNFLRAAGTEDMINTFGPMMDDLQGYQAMGVINLRKIWQSMRGYLEIQALL